MNNSLVRKQIYEDVTAKSYEDMYKYLDPIVTIYEDTTLEQVLDELDKKKNKDVKLWALFGKMYGHSEKVCLQVGASKDGIAEIRRTDILKNMFQEPDYIIDEENGGFTTEFYNYVYGLQECNNIYAFLKTRFKKLVYYSVDIDKYLNLTPMHMLNTPLMMRDIVEMGKPFYAEAMFAYETQSVFWNSYRNGLDCKTLMKILEYKKEDIDYIKEARNGII